MNTEYERNFGIVHMMITALYYEGGALQFHESDNGVDYVVFYENQTSRRVSNRINLTDLGLGRSDFSKIMQLPLMW